MKSYEALAALGLLFLGFLGAGASCSWNPLNPPTYDEAKDHSGGGFGGTGGTGTGEPSGTGAGGAGGAPACSNGKIELGESCDDGNPSNGDGCSSTCQVEVCWDCSSGACMPEAPNTPCNGAQVCDGKGVCGDCVSADMACDKCKNCAGSDCDESDDCASMVCVTGVCRSGDGSACSDPVECASDYCASKSCISCTKDSQCNSVNCNIVAGRCYAAVGEPCDNSTPCAVGLLCTAESLCKGQDGYECAFDYECDTNKCDPDNGCTKCSISPQCATGLCQQGVCAAALPDGAYCVNPSDCLSGACVGFPRKCEP